MSFKIAREEFINERRNLLNANRDYANLERGLASTRQSKSTLSQTYQSRIDTAKSIAFDAYLRKHMSPIETKINNLNSKKVSMDADYRKRLAEITPDKFKGKYKSTIVKTDKLKEISQAIESAVSNDVDSSFYTALNSYSDRYKFDIPLESFDEVLEQINSVNVKSIVRWSKFDLCIYLDKFLSLFNPRNNNAEKARKENVDSPDSEGENSGDEVKDTLDSGDILYIVFCCAFVGGLFYIGEYFMLLFFFLLCFNIYKNQMLKDLFFKTKSLSYSADSLTCNIDSKIQALIESNKDKLQTKYDKNCDTYQMSLARLQEDLSDAKISATNSFTFSSADIDNEFSSAKQSLELKESMEFQQLENKKSDIQKLEESVKRLEVIKEKEAQNLVNESYPLGQYGTSYELPKELLYSMTPNPTFFDLEKLTTLYLYDDLKLSSGLVKLIILNLSCHMHLFMTSSYVWDKRHMGSDFSCLNFKEYSEVLTSDDMIEECIEDIIAIMTKRISVISAEGADICSYNQNMIALDSVPESYMFLFIMNPDDKLLGNNKFKQILLNGPKVGVYPIMFVSQKELPELYKKSNDILDLTERFYVLHNDDILGRGKEVLLENLTDS